MQHPRGSLTLWLTILILLSVSATMMGQEITGSMTGFVTDQSAAAVPGANLTVTNVSTGVIYKALSGNNGLYVMSFLPPGRYDLSVEKSGFKKATITGIEVKVGTVVGKDVALEVGEVTQTVEVQADTNIVETQEPSLGGVIQERQLTELPL